MNNDILLDKIVLDKIALAQSELVDRFKQQTIELNKLQQCASRFGDAIRQAIVPFFEPEGNYPSISINADFIHYSAFDDLAQAKLRELIESIQTAIFGIASGDEIETGVGKIIRCRLPKVGDRQILSSFTIQLPLDKSLSFNVFGGVADCEIEYEDVSTTIRHIKSINCKES